MTLNNRVTKGVTPRVVPHIEARFTEWAQRESREMGNVPSKTNPIERRIRLADEPGSETRNRPIVTDFSRYFFWLDRPERLWTFHSRSFDPFHRSERPYQPRAHGEPWYHGEHRFNPSRLHEALVKRHHNSPLNVLVVTQPRPDTLSVSLVHRMFRFFVPCNFE